MVEKEHMGGICLNWSCIPTKSLIRNAEIINLLNDGKTFGFKFDNLQIDYSAAHKRSRQVSQRLVKGIGFLMKKKHPHPTLSEVVMEAAHATLGEAIHM